MYKIQRKYFTNYNRVVSLNFSLLVRLKGIISVERYEGRMSTNSKIKMFVYSRGLLSRKWNNIR